MYLSGLWIYLWSAVEDEQSRSLE